MFLKIPHLFPHFRVCGEWRGNIWLLFITQFYQNPPNSTLHHFILILSTMPLYTMNPPIYRRSTILSKVEVEGNVPGFGDVFIYGGFIGSINIILYLWGNIWTIYTRLRDCLVSSAAPMGNGWSVMLILFSSI